MLSYRTHASEISSAKHDRLQFGLIGAGWQPNTRRVGRGIAVMNAAKSFGEMVAICEIDSHASQYALARAGNKSARGVLDYRELLDRKDIDAVLIATPDHWHSKIAIEAMLAGKDVYLEKPATVTIREGQQLIDVVERTGRVLQVGTQQRSEYDLRFVKAAAMLRDGRDWKVETEFALA